MATAQTNTLLDTALTYAARGWHVFPCHTPWENGCSCTKHKACTDIGKHPRTKNGLSDATTDEAKIRRWWKMWPAANVAIRTGQVSGLVVLDRDDYKGGAESLEELERTYSPLPETVLGLTGGGGQHYVFAHPGSHLKTGVDILGPGLDTRADGGYIIAPPSLHKSGKRYTWEVLHEPDDTPLAPLPDWVRVLCQETTRQERVEAGAPIPDGQRGETLFKLGCSLRGRGFTEAVILAALREMNATQCQPPKSDAEVQKIVGSIAKYEAGPSREELHQQRNGDTPAPVPAWTKVLFATKAGELHETENNLQAIFAHHPFWQGRLWWDVVANRAYVDDRQSLDIHYVRNEVSPWLGATMRMPIRHGTRVLEVLRSWAQRQPRDPLQAWLATLPAQDETDLRRRLLNTWLHTYAGAEDTPYTRFVSRVLIASLVQRAMVPGVQYRYVVVLEGEENVGKTKLLRLLGDRWHQEFPKSVEGKEAYMQLQGYWLVELGELDALKPAQESRIKMFISQQMDVWVPKYENDVLERPRRAILVGTTNEREYLKGEHGNTRYLPVWLDGPIQHAKIAEVRDRLFTQAKHSLADHPDDWWDIPEDVKKEVIREREARKEPSVFEDVLRPFLLKRKQCTVAEALEEALHIPQAQWSKRLEMEVTKAFKDLGWYRHIERDATTKKVRRFWADTPQEKKEVPF